MRFPTRLAVLLAVAGAGFGAWWTLTREEPVAVRVQQAETGTVEELVSNTRAGTVKACRRARLAPSIGGQIATLAVHEGDRVKSGDLLLELWNRDLAAQVTLAERESEAADARARAACLHAEAAEREAERQIKLEKRRLASEEALDRAITAAQAGRADCEAAEATARVHAARVGVAQANLAKTRLNAPFDGVVAEVSGELNEYVTPSPPGIPTPPAVDLIDDSCYFISAPIDEVDAARVRLDAEARVTLDAFGERSFAGTVRRVAPYVLDLEKQARTVEVEVEIAEPPEDAPLLAGYSADVEILVERRKAVLRVPTAAVRPDDTLLVLNESGGELEAREINTGLSNWEQTEVTQGLEAGELVVLSLGVEGVEEGALATREETEKE
jgi:HlyD family secretion protein